MNSRNRNVDYEGVSMCHWNVGLIKVNTLNMITPIYTVECNKCTYIRTFNFFNTSSNEWTEDFCSFREVFNWDEIRKKADIFVHQYSLGLEVYLGLILQILKPQVWLDQIWNKYLQDKFYHSSSLCIDWYWTWIIHG